MRKRDLLLSLISNSDTIPGDSSYRQALDDQPRFLFRPSNWRTQSQSNQLVLQRFYTIRKGVSARRPVPGPYPENSLLFPLVYNDFGNAAEPLRRASPEASLHKTIALLFENPAPLPWIHLTGNPLYENSPEKADKFGFAIVQKRDAISEQPLSPRTPKRSKAPPQRVDYHGRPVQLIENPTPGPNSAPAAPTVQLCFKCGVEGCGKVFTTKHYLRYHERTKHSPNPLNFRCDAKGCGRVYTTKANLDMHKSINHSQNPARFECDAEGCNASFTREVVLVSHKKEKHSADPPRFRCNVEGCNMIYSRKSMLASHKKQKHSPNPPRFRCDVENCGKAFTSKGNLARHRSEKHS